MRKLIIYFICLLFVSPVLAQNGEAVAKKPFWKKLRLSQSMETAELKEEPAQFLITSPKKDSMTWLINLGISYVLNDNAGTSLSKLTAEYHRNTQTDKKQNNWQFGYGLSKRMGIGPDRFWYLSLDTKYVYDAEESKHSLAGNLLFSLYRQNSKFNWGTRNFSPQTASDIAFTPAFFLGTQLQQVMNAKNDSAKGFILRPLCKTSFYFDILNHDDPLTPSTSVRISADYTGRVDLVNTSKFKENYTDLFKAGVEWFLAYKPVRVSLGVSYNTGSDPLAGLAKQQFWLFSVNFFKGK